MGPIKQFYGTHNTRADVSWWLLTNATQVKGLTPCPREQEFQIAVQESLLLKAGRDVFHHNSFAYKDSKQESLNKALIKGDDSGALHQCGQVNIDLLCGNEQGSKNQTDVIASN